MDQFYNPLGQYHHSYASGSQDPSGSNHNDYDMQHTTELASTPSIQFSPDHDLRSFLSQTHQQHTQQQQQHHHNLSQISNYASTSSHSQSYFDTPNTHTTYDHSPSPQHQYLRPSSSPGLPTAVDPAIQLELLRETRRIRELDLQIAEASLRDSEEKRRIREAELAMAQLNNRPNAPSTSASTPNDNQFHSLSHSPNYNPAPTPSSSASGTGSVHDGGGVGGVSGHSGGDGDSGGGTGANARPRSAGGTGMMGDVSIDDVLDEAHWAQFSSSWIGAEHSTFLGAGGGGMQSFGGFASGLAMFDPVIPVLPEPGKQTKSILEQSLSAPPFPQDSPIDDATEDQDDQAAYTPDDPSSSSAMKSKKTGKIIETKNVHCTKCNQLIARLVLRGTREELDLPCDLLYQCLKCAPQTSVPPSASGARSGSRKRANELDDTEKFVTCDVCTHVRGHGGLRAKSREHIEFTAEFICLSCSEKYRRCTNCGGTSARGIVGKWRCKELFAGGRKTCSLSHARLGALDMELAVWVIPQELQGATELPALLECCEETWREHILGKLAVPEVLEHQSEMRSYSDIEKFLLVYEFPGKTLFTTPTKSPNHRRYVSLHWAKTRTRRNKNKPEWALVSHEEKMATQSSSDGWLTYNTKRSNVIRPAGAILCGMWMVEWIVPDKTAVVSTISPFDAVTTDERAPVHLSEIFRRALQELVKHNAEHPNDLWAPPEHIWMLLSKTGVTNRLRVTDGLERRSILPLDEYLTRHIEARPEQFDPHICGLSEHLIQRRPHMKFEVQVRHIGLGTTPEMVEKRAAGRLRRSVKKGR